MNSWLNGRYRRPRWGAIIEDSAVVCWMGRVMILVLIDFNGDVATATARSDVHCGRGSRACYQLTANTHSLLK